jgi:hypothetical protein
MEGKGNVGMRAHAAASKRLREAHAEEFAGMLKEERVKLGLPPEAPGGRQTTEQKIAKLEAKIAKLRGENDFNGEE